MIPYSKQYISNDDINEVKKVLKSKFLTQGNVVENFEKKICKYVGSKYAVAVSSASAGLHIACIALNLKKNDILWTVPNTFIASASCGLHCGAKVDFVDIDRKTKNISIDSLVEKLKIANKKKILPKILVPVHFAGQPTLQEEIYYLSKKYNFKIIEDASHSLGSIRLKNKVGNCKWSNFTVFSFHPVKPITTAEGGVVTTNDKKYYENLKILRNHGILRDKKKFKIKSYWYYEQIKLGFNYRMNEIQAALGISQLKKLDKFNYFRNKVANYYIKHLKGLPIYLPTIEKNNLSSFHLFVISFNEEKVKYTYDEIFKLLRKNGIGVNLHYLPLHLHPIFKKMGFRKGDFPISEEHSRTSFSIPLFYKISKKDQLRVIKVLKNIFK